MISKQKSVSNDSAYKRFSNVHEHFICRWNRPFQVKFLVGTLWFLRGRLEGQKTKFLSGRAVYWLSLGAVCYFAFLKVTAFRLLVIDAVWSRAQRSERRSSRGNPETEWGAASAAERRKESVDVPASARGTLVVRARSPLEAMHLS